MADDSEDISIDFAKYNEDQIIGLMKRCYLEVNSGIKALEAIREMLDPVDRDTLLEVLEEDDLTC